MKKETMITLDDDTSYVLLDETVVEDRKYFLAVRVDSETKNPTNDYEVFLESIEDGETYVDMLDESDFKQAILIDFTNNYMHTVGSMMERDRTE